jgi:hypothetical protein
MDNALENNNLEEGQVNDNVGQDEATQQQESGSDWESQAKYFQSEKDKLQAENQKLKQYEQVGQMLESRPDIVNTISGMVQGGQPTPEAPIELPSYIQSKLPLLWILLVRILQNMVLTVLLICGKQ